MDQTCWIVEEAVLQATPLPIASRAPNITLQRFPSEPVSLADLRGQIVVLVFSPPGWDPARAEQRAQYERVVERIPALAPHIVDLCEDGVVCRLDTDSQTLHMPVLSEIDPQGEVAAAFGVSGRHALFVIDEAGIVRWSYVAAIGVAPKPDDLFAGLESLAAPSSPDGQSGKLPILTRRQFVAAAVATAFALSLASVANQYPAQAKSSAIESPQLTPAPPDSVERMITLKVNGADHRVSVEPRVTLLDALRERIGLTGTKKGCDHGQCGACTVHLGGRRVNSCLMLAVACNGKQIATIEGLANADRLHPLQEAFIARDGFQCGYCTPGQIMSGAAMLGEDWGPTDDHVREAMSGNLCRCGAYPNIVAAIQDVRLGRHADEPV